MSETIVSSPPRPYRYAVATAMAFVTVFLALSAWYARYLDWNAIRLAPAAALLSGETIYPAADRGVVTGHIYSPLGALAFSPVAWLPNISTMMSLASLLAMAYFALPFVWLARSAMRRDGVAMVDALAVTSAALLLAVFDVRLRYATVMVHAEAPAVGLAGLAIVIAAATARGEARGWFWCGVVAVAAVWAKQTLLPTWLALGLAAALCGRACLWRYIAGSAVAAGGLAVWIAVQENWRGVVYNCLWIPAHHPWDTPGYAFTWGEPAVAQTLAARGRAVVDRFLQVASAWWPAFVLLAWSVGRLRTEHLRTGSIATRTASFAVIVALAQFPLALASFVKVGADVNALDPLLVPLTLMLAALALEAFSPRPGDRIAGMRRAFIGLLLVLAACNLPRLVFLGQTVVGRSEPNAPMLAYLRANPGQVYLPWNPLHTWVAERRRDHFEYGVFDRALAGQPLTYEHYRAQLPPHLRLVAVRKTQPPLRLDMYKHYLAELRPTAAPPGLEDWAFYAVSEPNQSRAVQPAGASAPAGKP